MKYWNIGNTTVRNPNRLKDGLRVLKVFEGQIWNQEQHEKYYKMLLSQEVIDDTGRTLSKNSAGINGRKWAAVFNQLGLAKAWSRTGPVVITDVGNALLEDKYLEHEIFLRQLLKYQLPSPIEQGTAYEGFNVNPFQVTLNVLSALKKAGLQGITKEEISLYLITTINNSTIKSSIKNIIEYRNTKNSLEGSVAKRKFYGQKKEELIINLYKEELLAKYSLLKHVNDKFKQDNAYIDSDGANALLRQAVTGGTGSGTSKAQATIVTIKESIKKGEGDIRLYDYLNKLYVTVKGATLSDYADSAVRYFSKSELLSISGNKLIIKDTEEKLVEHIIEKGMHHYNESEYLEIFYNPTLPLLPSDNDTFMQENILSLYEMRDNLSRIAGVDTKQVSKKIEISSKSIQELKKIQQDVKYEVVELKEINFYHDQAKQSSDILSYFEQIENKTLLGGSAYLPAYLEWNTWRVFLAINTIKNDISSTRNFRIDEELNPIHHAKAGMPDMVFEYEDFVVVCEVTLTTRANQWSAEGESVPRHVSKVVTDYPNKPVYGLFIAPTIDPNTAQQFYTQSFWNGTEYVKLNIAPLTIQQLKNLIKSFGDNPFTVSRLKNIFESIFEEKKNIQNGMEWLVSIRDFIQLK